MLRRRRHATLFSPSEMMREGGWWSEAGFPVFWGTQGIGGSVRFSMHVGAPNSEDPEAVVCVTCNMPTTVHVGMFSKYCTYAVSV